jgi:DNA-binding HxlR family transcriptional regulator
MAPQNIDKLNCSIASALDIIGEGWTILILREAFFGSCRFEDFQKHLGIARNILTVRLNKLCDHGVLVRVPIKEGARRNEYKLTPMGRDLYAVLIGLTQWGDRWLLKSRGAPVLFVERATGKEVADLEIFTKDGKKLKARELAVKPGPGATAETRARLEMITRDRQDKRVKSK